MVLCPCVSANFGFLNSDGYKYGGPVLLGVGYYLLFGLVLSSLMIWRSRNWAIPGTRRVDIAEHLLQRRNKVADAPSPVNTPIPISPTPSVVPEDDESVSPVPASASAVVAIPPEAARPESLATSHSIASSLPFTPATLAFEGITYDIVHSETKATVRLLNGVTGLARPGRMTALMGASGAGL